MNYQGNVRNDPAPNQGYFSQRRSTPADTPRHPHHTAEGSRRKRSPEQLEPGWKSSLATLHTSRCPGAPARYCASRRLSPHSLAAAHSRTKPAWESHACSCHPAVRWVQVRSLG